MNKTDRQKREEFYRKSYKNTPFQWPNPNEVNMENYFFHPKVLSQNNGKISRQALAVFPVVAAHADLYGKNGVHIHTNHIAKYAGIGRRQAIEGLYALEENEYFNGKKLINRHLIAKEHEQGRTEYYEYFVNFPRKTEKNFIFHKCLIFLGLWAQLSYKGKLLYLAMRETAKFDRVCYAFTQLGVGPEELDKKIRDGDFDWSQRLWDFTGKSVKNLCDIAGIDQSRISKEINQLEHVGLVERQETGFVVFLRPENKIKNVQW